MKSTRLYYHILALAAGLCLTGCLNLKPAPNTARYFTLSAPAAEPGARSASWGHGLGLGPVVVPSYLLRNAMAVRKSPTEIEYLPDALWAERLDSACQRALAGNLERVLQPTHILLSAWHPRDIRCALHVELQQFDVDAQGLAALSARWRVVSPDGTLLKAGESHLTKSAVSPTQDPAAAAGGLSALLGDFSRELAQAISAQQSGAPR